MNTIDNLKKRQLNSLFKKLNFIKIYIPSLMISKMESIIVKIGNKSKKHLRYLSRVIARFKHKNKLN
ncbi:MAG: hypothetical protein ACKESC_01565 [Candidatus Hodgkinia cicadicola]